MCYGNESFWVLIAYGAVFYAVQGRMTIQEKAIDEYCLFCAAVLWRDISLQVLSTYTSTKSETKIFVDCVALV